MSVSERVQEVNAGGILVIKLRAIGDVLLSTVVLPNLRSAFPDTRIDFLTEQAALGVLTGNRFIDEVLVFDRKSMGSLDLLRLVRSRRYGTVIDLFGNPRTALVTFLSGATRRVGFRFRGRTYAYNVVVEPRGGSVHNTQFNLDAIEALGIAIIDRNLYFPVGPDDEAYIDQFLEKEGLKETRFATINTSGGWSTKRWGIERFAWLADRITSKYGFPVVPVWGPGEEQDLTDLARMMKTKPVPAPPTSLKQLGALLGRSEFLVSNDSGPMHIAAAVGTPVLGIYGPTNPVLQGPYGEKHHIVRNEPVPCLGCNLTVCPIHHPCMNELTVDTVESALRELLRRNNITR
jgi:ADP-heptose:LPS heptosyltransferase